MDNKTMNHEDFVRKYKSKNITVYPKQTKSIPLILSKKAGWYYKPGILFFTIISILLLLVFIGSLIFLFVDFREAIKVTLIGLVGGLSLLQITMKVSADLVIKEMVDNKIFFDYIFDKKRSDVYIAEK